VELLQTETPLEREQILKRLMTNFAEIGRRHDRAQTVPVENIEVLRKSGYAGLAVGETYGGAGISLQELLSLQELISREDGPTALSIGWHMGTMYQERTENNWSEYSRETILHDVVKKGFLLNTAATEKATGSPTRGGQFQTTAQKKNHQWILNGEKTFYTLVEELDYYLILATIEEDASTGMFLIEKGAAGIEIDRTWDMVSMGSTGSHDLILKNVTVSEQALLKIQEKKGSPQAWLLHIPACYLGIGYAAIQEASRYAKEYAPNSLGKPIATIPAVRQKLGEAYLLYQQSHTLLYGIAKQWDEGSNEERASMRLPLMMAKHAVVQKAMKMVDLAMKVVGAHSLSHQSPLSRYYRNVRAGLHNPPMDDQTVEVAAASLLNE